MENEDQNPRTLDENQAQTEELSREELERRNADLESQLRAKTNELTDFEGQLQKLTNVTKLIADGAYFFYTPSVSDDQNVIALLAANFNTMLKSIKSHQEGLETKVRERTAELEQTLKEVQDLKGQQDADYYLTSLLLNPLSANKAKHENVRVDFLILQKKKFKFRAWDANIGGDLCSAHTIPLMDNSYTVFLNADAMGKSIQGAGGALVLGAVFESIIQRTLINRERQEQQPEAWLKSTFIELQKVFESFDGSMMISLVIGLVENTSGFFYWLNAEHPNLILYRDGKAEFFEEPVIYRKIGMPLTRNVNWKDLRKDEPLKVRTAQLQDGDVIIAGSDGRDDLAIGEDEHGQRIINEDETLFLRIVEESQADLQRIYESTQRKGTLTDDLGLLRLGFREGGGGSGTTAGYVDMLNKSRQAYREGNVEDAVDILVDLKKNLGASREVLRDLAVIHYNMKGYDNAASYGQEYLAIEPDDTRLLFLTQSSLIKIGDLERAARLGERLLELARDVKQQLRLARIYRKLGNMGRCRDLLNDAHELEPNNDKVREFRAQLKM